MSAPTLARRLAAEFIGSAFLLATIIGSGIMGERLAGGNEALALLGNTLPTGAILVVLITMLGPISGAHLNPAVTGAFWLRGDIDGRDAAFYVLAQVAGALVGVLRLTPCSSCRSGRPPRRSQRPRPMARRGRGDFRPAVDDTADTASQAGRPCRHRSAFTSSRHTGSPPRRPLPILRSPSGAPFPIRLPAFSSLTCPLSSRRNSSALCAACSWRAGFSQRCRAKQPRHQPQ